MGILCDFQIRALCSGERPMLAPFDEALLNPASIDVRLGPRLLIESATSRELVPYDLAPHSQEAPYWLQPSQFVLGETLETFNVPSDVAIQFALKSSRAREGIEHLMAGFADPGFNGSVLTLELHNSRQLHPVALWPSMKIGQLICHRMDDVPLRDYSLTGRYNGCLTVAGSRG
jgi:dCTP deaminase